MDGDQDGWKGVMWGQVQGLWEGGGTMGVGWKGDANGDWQTFMDVRAGAEGRAGWLMHMITISALVWTCIPLLHVFTIARVGCLGMCRMMCSFLCQITYKNVCSVM